MQIGYLSLDVEGMAEDYINKSFPFDQYKIKIMTLEWTKLKFYTIVQSHGYKCLSILIWIELDFLNSLNAFIISYSITRQCTSRGNPSIECPYNDDNSVSELFMGY